MSYQHEFIKAMHYDCRRTPCEECKYGFNLDGYERTFCGATEDAFPKWYALNLKQIEEGEDYEKIRES